MKKLIAAAMAVMLMGIGMSVCTAPVSYASEITPYYTYAGSATSGISISNKTATCTTKASGKTGAGVTKIVITQTLQKQVGSDWAKVGESKVKTFNSSSAEYENDFTNLYSGTYRTKSEVKFYKDSAYETVTDYSITKSC